jgi:hypothetical protein
VVEAGTVEMMSGLQQIGARYVGEIMAQFVVARFGGSWSRIAATEEELPSSANI